MSTDQSQLVIVPTQYTTNPPPPMGLTSFFAQWPTFDYNPSGAAWVEFKRLEVLQGWDNKANPAAVAAGQAARTQFRAALVVQFNEIYGTRDNNLEGWQRLCQRVGVEPAPTTVGAARRAIKSIYVCLVDLVDKYATDEPIKKFKNARELRTYVRQEKKVFPKEGAKNTGLLRHLLRALFNFRRGRKSS